ncbi:hypothetical protein PHLCEN_2v8256 [Hermanssonia centrifuga]|uniref:Alanine racemase N-terminal domain-containing protein n=1 Tax=Hermanssonia centrifuga TaxID=98765 RepID=A0A2R6NU17_9APHY|nr:hypothetical protein PHLCEN_2v8256 [Hermanssonia centrifuga]
MSSFVNAPVPKASQDRVAELQESLAEIRSRIQQACSPPHAPALVAVSKYKPASDILACYEDGQRDFGENYVQELEAKAQQTVTSAKAATGLNKYLPAERSAPLNILLQVNTSGEDNKSGVPPLSPDSPSADVELTQLARHIIKECPRLHFQGLMTIGSLTESLSSAEKENEDFERLKQTRDLLQEALSKEFPADSGKWGLDGRLLLSMGMSSDFEAALKAGSDIVRVGTGIFGTRPKKTETVVAT